MGPKKKKGPTLQGPTVAQQLMVPYTQRLEKKLGNVAKKRAQVLLDAINAQDKDGKVDHRVRILATDKMEESTGNAPVKKTELSGTDGQPITVIVKKFSEETSGD